MMLLKSVLVTPLLKNAIAPKRAFHGASTLMASSYPMSKTGKPLGPFMRFVAENRAKVSASNKDFSVTQVASELGRLWRALPESERTRYKTEYQQVVNKK